MSTSLPSPPSQELPDPSSPSAISVPPLPLLAPIPQTINETNAESSSSLLITPTPSTAPPPPLPVTATPPSAPHPGDDPAASALESIGASRGGGEGLVDAGEVAAMEVEPTSSAQPPPAAPAPSTSASTSSAAASAGPTASAPFVPPPPPPRVDPTIALRDFHATMERRGKRADTREMRRAAFDWTRTEVRTSHFSSLDSYYLVPLLLSDLASPNISVAVSTLSTWVRKHHYTSGDPIYYQLATLISAIKTKTHGMIWEAVRGIEEILAQPPQNEFDVVAKLIASYLFTPVKINIRSSTLAIVEKLYETIPVAEFQRYTGWPREEALAHAQEYSYGFDVASDLLSPVPAPKQLRQATTTTKNFDALARGILQVEMMV